MLDPNALTADQLLAIPPGAPEQLFANDHADIARLWRQLAWRWHPDRAANPDECTRVFAHLATLRRTALERLASGIWQRPGELELRATDGRQFRLRFCKRHEIDLGELYIGPTAVAFLIDREYADLFDAGVTMTGSFVFANDPMCKEIARCLPVVRARFDTADRRVLVVAKRADHVLLCDLLEFFGGRLEARHAAWVLSGLYNLACYFGYAGIAQNAITTDSLFVSPSGHDGLLLGGWWYAGRHGRRLTALPQAALAVAPSDVIRDRVASPRIDLELIRALGRELLGDPSGLTLERLGTPKPMAAWLRLASGGDPIEDYAGWQQVLIASFGARRYCTLPVTEHDIYP